MLENKNSFYEEVTNKILSRKYFVDFTVEMIFFIIKILICIAIYLITLKIVKKILPLFKKASEKDSVMDESLKSFLGSIFNIGLHILLVTLCLLILGVKESSLLAFFGTLGIGIGLSLKDNLANFAGGIMLIIFKVYKVGDEVSISGHRGYVYEIDIFCTTIRTSNNDLVLIPNGNIVSNKIINFTKTPVRRLKFIISIGYNDNIEVARKVLEELLSNTPGILAEPVVYSHVEEYADSSINIALKGWCNNEDYWHIYKLILNEIKPTLDKANISIPFPQMDIHTDK